MSISSRARRSIAPALALGVAFLGLLACRPSAEAPLPPRRIELAAWFARALARIETPLVDLGTAAVRERLDSGWSADEVSGGTSFVWALGRVSTLRVTVVEPRDRVLRLRGWAHGFADGPTPMVEARVNGHSIGRAAMPTEPAAIRFAAPEEVFVVGENFVDLIASRWLAPSVVGRELSIAWDAVGFDGSDAAGGPRFDPATETLTLPARTAFELVGELPGGAVLAWDRIEAPAELAFTVDVREEGRRPASSLDRSESGPGRLPLTGDGPAILVGLTLRATGEQGEVVVTGLRVQAPDLAVAATGPPSAGAESIEGETIPAVTGERPNLVLYIVDSLRADHLGCYGYPRSTSPALDAFAAGSTRFAAARAQSSWTRPAVASLLSGLQPPSHRAEDLADRLPDEVETLAERLRGIGYQTAMITTSGLLSPRFGVAQGFDFFDYLAERSRTREVHQPSDRANAVAFDWLARRERTRPFLLVVHTSDPHAPYTPRQVFRRRLAAEVGDAAEGSLAAIARLAAAGANAPVAAISDLVALYDGEVAQNDAAFGALLGRLGREGELERSVVVFVGDHGEALGEHGRFGHGGGLGESELRIPLVVRLPAGRGSGRVVADPVDQVDLVPTLLDLLGRSAPADLAGRSLLPAIDGLAAPRRRPSFAWLRRGDLVLRAAAGRGFKRLELAPEGAHGRRVAAELFDLVDDPGERRDLARERRLVDTLLAGELELAERRQRSRSPREPVEIDAELRRRLRELGYAP